MVNIEKLHKGINDFSKNEPVMIENISKCKAKVDNLQMGMFGYLFIFNSYYDYKLLKMNRD